MTPSFAAARDPSVNKGKVRGMVTKKTVVVGPGDRKEGMGYDGRKKERGRSKSIKGLS